nr:immunoglobulin light chain junction region [Macaca mulatta]
CMQPLEFPWTS